MLGPTQRPRWLAHTAFNRAEVALARGDLSSPASALPRLASCTRPPDDDGGVAAVDERTAAVLNPR